MEIEEAKFYQPGDDVMKAIADKQKHKKLNPKQRKAFNKVCDRIRDGQSLRKACEPVDVPNISTILRWLKNDESGALCIQYARAREIQADMLFDEILEIADNATSDVTFAKDGTKIVNHENIQRARLRIDTRKWFISKLQPKKYSEKAANDVGGEMIIRIGDKDADCC